MSSSGSGISWTTSDSVSTQRVAAFFDVDGTLLEGNIIRYYGRLRRREMGRIQGTFFLLGLLARVPYYWTVDQFSREALQTRFYRNYRVFSPHQLASAAARFFEEELKRKLYVPALERIAEHRARGHLIVLVSGSIRQIVSPVAAHIGADAVLCTDLEERNGVLTGAVRGGSLAGDRKAAALRGLAREHGISLAQSYAYADSLDDVPMLSCVGSAVVVNAGERLRKVASEKGWGRQVWRPSP